MAKRSIPKPKAKPVHSSGSTPQAVKTAGSTMPQPPSSIQRTASLDAVEFKAPVRVGDVVNFWAHTTRMGTKSVTVRIEVEAQRYNTGESVVVTSAQLTMVSVDADGKPIPYASAATV